MYLVGGDSWSQSWCSGGLHSVRTSRIVWSSHKRATYPCYLVATGGFIVVSSWECVRWKCWACSVYRCLSRARRFNTEMRTSTQINKIHKKVFWYNVDILLYITRGSSVWSLDIHTGGLRNSLLSCHNGLLWLLLCWLRGLDCMYW